MAAVAAAAVALAGAAIPTARAAEPVPSAVIASLSKAPKDDGSVALTVSGQAAPANSSIAADTMINGTCVHCQLGIHFHAADAAKGCAPCGCGMTNAACIVGSAPKGTTWQQMLQLLPRGTVLKVTYAEGAKPESGVKTISIDRHSALLALDGSAINAAQLADAAKAAGASKSELLADGKQAMLSFSGTWTKDRQSKFEEALAKAGAKLASAGTEQQPQ